MVRARTARATSRARLPSASCSAATFSLGSRSSPTTSRSAKRPQKRGLAYVGYGSDGALHGDAASPTLAGLELAVAVQDGDANLFSAVEEKLATVTDEAVRTRLLGALASVRDPSLGVRALGLGLDPRVRHNELTVPLDVALGQVDTRDAAFAWLRQNLDPFMARLGRAGSGRLPWRGVGFCDRAHATELGALFGPRLGLMEGGPRNLAGAIETTLLCAARKDAQIGSLRTFFGTHR